MDKTAIKNFAVWARVKLMEDIRTRLGFLGITEDGIASPLSASAREVQYFDIGADHPVSIKGVAIRQRETIANQIHKAEKESNYVNAYQHFIETSAYDWFNRLIAIRYMELNEYAPLDVRLLSSIEPGKQDPDLVTAPFDSSLEYTEKEEQQIRTWKEEHDNNKLFRFLLFKMCNQLHEVLPGIFEGKEDASELLMRQSFIDKDGVIHHLVTDIPEEDWKDQVQIIGWIYQYYNSELKSEIFAKKGKVTKEELPAVTQLFTPDWIVRYMVENSLGRLWIEHLRGIDPSIDEKETAEQFGWKYYLPEAKQEPEVQQQLKQIREESYAKLTPEDLTCLDPCMGSGHILVYIFDVLEQIYTSVGYSERDAAKSILEHNIYGLDIDDRAYQLAYFAVMMKARQYNRRILTSDIKPHVYSIQESNGITKQQLQEMGVNLSAEEKAEALKQAEQLVDLLQDAKEYGSILNIPEMDWDLLRRFAEPDNSLGQTSLNWNQDTSERLIELIDQGQVMAEKYWITCTNPPYMAIGNGNSKLNRFVKENYSNVKADLFGIFIYKCMIMGIKCGYQALITMHAWMFLSSFEKLRPLMQQEELINMVHLGARAFEEIGGEVVQTTSFVLRKMNTINYKGTYIRLVESANALSKQKDFFDKSKKYITDQRDFLKIPGHPYAYWLSSNALKDFSAPAIGEKALLCQGLTTTNNDLYVRHWYEVAIQNIGFGFPDAKKAAASSIKWFPFNKGGSYRKWYGNNELIVNYQDDGYEIKQDVLKKYPYLKTPDFVVKNSRTYFRQGLTWSALSNEFSIRWFEQGAICADKGQGLFADEETECYSLALLNSKVGAYFLKVISPTLDFNCGYVRKVPFIHTNERDIYPKIEVNIKLCKDDWDSIETSWDFRKHPLIANESKLSDSFSIWQNECDDRFNQLKYNEEELNRIFIDIYGLQDELTPEEDDKDVTVHKADLERDIRSLLSYVIGCIFGRYSLDQEGLIYAGGDWKSVQSVYKTFLPDADNVVPITDQKYLEDDVVERICEFLTVVYGADTLEENLDFIAKALGNKGLTSREVIRNYMLNDFFKDHCKTYSVTGSGKRPIYWLFDSGKQNAFKALVYMHRWDADTTGRVLLYAQQIQQKYETEVRAIDVMLDHITDSKQASTEEKRREHLKKQLDELTLYEERLEHMANERIAIDLDDGVKVNYEKVQTDRNGRKYQILAPIK